jgi:ribosomal protein S18 acetylase RimI-like enzyme
MKNLVHFMSPLVSVYVQLTRELITMGGWEYLIVNQNMDFGILDYSGTAKEDKEITALLNRVFVQDGFTEKSYADKFFVSSELRKRGDLKLAKSNSGHLLGMVIFVPPTSTVFHIANNDEAEIQLLAVYPEWREHGVASRLIDVCEKLAVSCCFSKIVLSTQPTMKAAHRLYEKHGYRRNPKRDWTRTEDKNFFVYEKLLRNSVEE